MAHTGQQLQMVEMRNVPHARPHPCPIGQRIGKRHHGIGQPMPLQQLAPAAAKADRSALSASTLADKALLRV
jgi:hypothetical protein